MANKEIQIKNGADNLFPTDFNSWSHNDIKSLCTSEYTIRCAYILKLSNGLSILNVCINNGETGIPKNVRISNLITLPEEYALYSSEILLYSMRGNDNYQDTSYTECLNIPIFMNSLTRIGADPQNGLYAPGALNSSGNINCINLKILYFRKYI